MHTLWPSNSISDTMNSLGKANRLIGLALLFSSIFLFLIYSYFLLSSQWGLLILQATVLVAVAAMAAVMAWIGFTMATAPRT
jgi:predicted RND superfamily exporter protein